ncbi:YybH family protein [Sinosporangium siamense]|uniref:SnoaL-like domain-containing protein n=1 Tax=Sinosporangium siamense TaxID=1367973 RepID=A0A919V596_9ACTN|nr:SgcJ/EcaC family oxidoreductase [Sinosporangium siamense]GII90601.1 hypothetical protein Ssi02_08320 [Sinosporangium siamense]
MTSTDDKTQIEELIRRWAAAVHAGDMDGVLDGHTDDIVMFDVPPPYEGVHGIDAYRETWPGFFTWQAQGARFDITSLEVTAGDDVAFAHALLRCGTPEGLEQDPELRLRLTLGLRKENGRWLVSHEHHSFPDPGTAADEEEIRSIHRHWSDRTSAKDLDGLMQHIADDIVSYEHDAPLQHEGSAAVREVCRTGLAWAQGAVGWTVPDLTVMVDGSIAVAWGLNRMEAEFDGQMTESWSRGTRVFRRTGTTWEVIHQHLSYPYDPKTGETMTGLHP